MSKQFKTAPRAKERKPKAKPAPKVKSKSKGKGGATAGATGAAAEATAGAATEKEPIAEESACNEEDSVASSQESQPEVPARVGQQEAGQQPEGRATMAQPETTIQEIQNTMTIKLIPSTKQRKDDRLVVFNIEGRSGQFQCLRSLFGDNTPGDLMVSGDGIVEATAKTVKVKETPEERKARLAALPKLTPAEKLDRAEKRVAALKAKVAAAESA